MKYFILITIVVCGSFALTAESAPATPNESLVEGRVLEYSVVSSKLLNMEPEQTLYALTVLVEQSTAVKGPDMLKKEAGRTVRFYSKQKLEPELFGRKIKAKASYRGDERGGLHWIYEIRMAD